MPKKHLTYKQAGVDIHKADKLIDDIGVLVEKTNRPEVLKGIGGFGGLFGFDAAKYKNPVLVSSSDGVGTKLKIAFLANKHDTVGIDLVAMNVNDILCCGAEPLFFLDYVGCGVLERGVFKAVIKGIADGCKEAGCALIGGETAEMPSMYKKGEYDLAGFCVGVAEREKIITGAAIASGDVAIGLASSGLHSNGFSLVRKVFSKNELVRYAKELLKPTRIYVKPVLSVLRDEQFGLVGRIKGIAHVTGGAFYEKIKRILPESITLEVQKQSWQIPEIFKLIQNKGSVTDKEMFHTFNMGIGMVCIVDKDDADRTVQAFATLGVKSWVIGRTLHGKREVIVR